MDKRPLNPTQRRIRRQLEHADRKAFRQTGAHLDFAKLRGVKIQTASPMLRMLLVAGGAAFSGVIVWLWWTKNSPTWSLPIALVGVAFIALGVVGRKKDVHRVFESLGDEIVSRILDGLF